MNTNSGTATAGPYGMTNKSTCRFLAAEVVCSPEKQGEDDTDQDAGGERKVYGPSAAAPGEVARETAEGKMEATEAEDDEASYDQNQAKEDEGAA
jgi:hypothetical protein